ncbi:U-box domain-containing protein [Xylariaceae sp. FL0804]|nr:U-box domain-containing protein [Xylariaceae sp. FL0804]
MARDADRATQLKEDGNRFFQAGDFLAAESLYSKAIVADKTNPSFYTNRAMTRIKLDQFDSAISDCEACLKLSSNYMKAYFLLSQCQLALHDYNTAVESAVRAQQLCAQTNDKSLIATTQQVLRCKRDRLEDLEKKRPRKNMALEQRFAMLRERERDEELRYCRTEIERRDCMDKCAIDIATMRVTFEVARDASEKKRKVPDWATCDISFQIMVDPVTTPSGNSYERAHIMTAIENNHTDPRTRQPLYPYMLRPNLNLRQAIEEWVAENAWAKDF